MLERTRVLVLGASGMIGREVLSEARNHPALEMLPASHRSVPGYEHVEYEALTSAQAWQEVLRHHRVDAVVNCVGIWSGTGEEFERIQYTVPVALFDACAQLGVRIVHVSALGFSPHSVLPYASTKARADRYLLESCPVGTVVYPSLVFGSDGNSSKFFLSLAALPVQVDFGLPKNLQPVHVQEVARAVVGALVASSPPRTVDCAGPYRVSVPEYFDALREGMGLGRAPLRIKVPTWCARVLFSLGERVGAHFVNRQTWVLLQDGTHGKAVNPQARAYESFAGARDLERVRELQLYWFARLGTAFLWLWTAFATMFLWPHSETLSWLDSLWAGLGTPGWLWASCALDASMGIASLVWPRRRLWKAQFWLTAGYTVGLAASLPWAWSHPFGPLTKNLAVMATMLFLASREVRR